MERKGQLRRLVSWAFGIVSVVAAVVFEQAISAFATKRGWDQIFVNGWKVVSDVGWGGAVAFLFFALGGATIALWLENSLRDRREEKLQLERHAGHCTARFKFTKTSEGDIDVALDGGSDNVSYWLWYVNNGGSRHNEAVVLFVEFEKEIARPEVFVHATNAGAQQWRLFGSTDRFAFVEVKGWPVDEIIVQAINSQNLGLDRMSELMVWRGGGPL